MPSAVRPDQLNLDPRSWPSSIRDQDPVGADVLRGREDQRVGKAKPAPMSRTQLRGALRELPRDGLHIGGQVVQEFIHGSYGGRSTASGRDQYLCVDRCRHGQHVSTVDRGGDSAARRSVVNIIGVEDADDDSRIQDGQSHSFRS